MNLELPWHWLTHLWRLCFRATSPKNGGNIWLYKWGDYEENLNMKISPGGFGGESIERTSDNGFIISTSGGTVIKTDSQLEY